MRVFSGPVSVPSATRRCRAGSIGGWVDCVSSALESCATGAGDDLFADTARSDAWRSESFSRGGSQLDAAGLRRIVRRRRHRTGRVESRRRPSNNGGAAPLEIPPKTSANSPQAEAGKPGFAAWAKVRYRHRCGRRLGLRHPTLALAGDWRGCGTTMVREASVWEALDGLLAGPARPKYWHVQHSLEFLAIARQDAGALKEIEKIARRSGAILDRGRRQNGLPTITTAR